MIIKFYEKFAPYEIHNRSVLKLEKDLEDHQDRKLRPILFEGQGIGRVFDDHRKNLKQKLVENYFNTDVPRIEELAEKLDRTAVRIERSIATFKEDRAARYFLTSKIKFTDDKLHGPVTGFVNRLYENVYTSVAFEAALICTLFILCELVNEEKKQKGKQPVNVESIADEYLEQLNSYFVPKTNTGIKMLVGMFKGTMASPPTAWDVTPSNSTHGSVVVRGEMQPDQWPKYKYLLLEIWNPTDQELATIVNEERDKCRGQIFMSLYKLNRNQYAKDNSIHEEKLEATDRDKIFNYSYTSFHTFLGNAGILVSDRPQQKDLLTLLDDFNDDASAEDETSEEWPNGEE